MFFQRTLNKSINFKGIGLHSGHTVSVQIRPALADTGIVFLRNDLASKPFIKANGNNVFDTTLATRIGENAESSISTIEHLMGAFFGLGIDNAIVELDSSEFPIVDGSALPLLTLLDEAGIKELDKPKKALLIKKAVEIFDAKNPDRFIRVEPARKPRLSYSIEFAASAIGKQQISIDLTSTSFCTELSAARTFCLERDINAMLAQGLARGGSHENAIVVSSEKGVLNPEGLRYPTEFVRHKALDCVGDLYLLGMPIIGHVIAHKAGHDLHTKLVKKILSELSLHEIIVATTVKEEKTLRSLLPCPNSLAELKGRFEALNVMG